MTKITHVLFDSQAVIRVSMLAIVVTVGWGLSDSIALAEELPATAKTVAGLALPNLEIRQDKNRLFFVLPEGKPLLAKITLPRLANVVKSVHWIAEDNPTMQVTSEPTEWTIEVSQCPDKTAAIIVVELDAPLELFNKTITKEMYL